MLDELILGIGWYTVFLFSVTFHEAAHAFIAWRGGDRTAYDGGQVSLNPLPHIRREPIGMVVLPLFMVLAIGFPIGWASAPFDPFGAARHPQRAAYMALAGPASNLLVAVVAGFILWVGLNNGTWLPGGGKIMHLVVTPEGHPSPVGMLLSMLFALNLMLAVLNMIPFPPLDGSAVVPLFLPKQMIDKYVDFINQPFLSFIGIFLAWKLFPVIYKPVLATAVSLIYGR